jgi:hypothetical protein
MNKYLTCLPAVILLGGIMWMQAKKATQSNLANKDISFAVYKSHSYKSGVYDNTSAQVHIVVEKINTSGQHTIVWKKTMDAETLSKYPAEENALKQNVTIHNVNEKKEYLLVDYTLVYNSKGSELQMHDAEIVNDNNPGKINISI